MADNQGTMTETIRGSSGETIRLSDGSSAHVRRSYSLKLVCTSNASGAVNKTTAGKISGFITEIRIVPNTDGSQPTNLFDVVINDEDAFDILWAGGANLANDSNTLLCPFVTSNIPHSESPTTLNVQISNAGASKIVTIYIFTD